MPSSIMVTEPVLACATGQPRPAYDVYPDCQGAETWLEREGREESMRIKVADRMTRREAWNYPSI